MHPTPTWVVSRAVGSGASGRRNAPRSVGSSPTRRTVRARMPGFPVEHVAAPTASPLRGPAEHEYGDESSRYFVVRDASDPVRRSRQAAGLGANDDIRSSSPVSIGLRPDMRVRFAESRPTPARFCISHHPALDLPGGQPATDDLRCGYEVEAGGVNPV
jgi:hypothetical protein